MRTGHVLRRFARQERGATLALTAVMIASVTAVLALSIDLGVLYVAHAEAQRAADGGALAGASAFLDHVPASTAVQPAMDRAYAYTRKNFIRNQPIDSAQIQVDVDVASQQVYVRVEQPSIPMWFARLLGINSRGVAASAVAHAGQGTRSSKCVAPLALPDWWMESDATEDVNGDRVWDENEEWTYDPEDGDLYRGSGDAEEGEQETGLGSDFRNETGSPTYSFDWGRRILLKPQFPGQQNRPESSPAWFAPLDLNPDGGQGASRKNYGDLFLNAALGNCAEWQFVSVGDTLPIMPGNRVGPTQDWADDVVALDDDDIDWDDLSDENRQRIRNSNRTVAIVMIEPIQLDVVTGGNGSVVVSDIALFYIEGVQGSGRGGRGGGGGSPGQDPVIGRFLEYAQGTGGPGPSGALVKVLQLIK